jgi:nucleotide-binding universal stress UspA family protein
VADLRGPVIVSMDGSPDARQAAGYGAWEAERRHVTLRMVFAEAPLIAGAPGAVIPGAYPSDSPYVHDMLCSAEKEVTDAHPGILVETLVLPSGPAAALISESHFASLVVLATHAGPGITGRLRGSITANVASHAFAPVVVLRPQTGAVIDPETSHRPVVVGFDGSSESARALAFGVDEALARNVELRAVYVFNDLAVDDMARMLPANTGSAGNSDTASSVGADVDGEHRALQLVTEATAVWSARYPDLALTNHAVYGLDPVASLARAGQSAGLIVVGSRGHGGFLGLRLGSTVDGLLRCASAPVAVVRDRSTRR